MNKAQLTQEQINLLYLYTYTEYLTEAANIDAAHGPNTLYDYTEFVKAKNRLIAILKTGKKAGVAALERELCLV